MPLYKITVVCEQRDSYYVEGESPTQARNAVILFGKGQKDKQPGTIFKIEDGEPMTTYISDPMLLDNDIDI